MALTGGAVLPKAIGERFQQRTGITLFLETSGMTETAAAIAFNPGRGEPLAGSVGFRAPYAMTRIVSLQSPEQMQECPKLTSGLVIVRGPQVFPGYVDPLHNVNVLTDDGWLVTGDIGYLTEDERLTPLPAHPCWCRRGSTPNLMPTAIFFSTRKGTEPPRRAAECPRAVSTLTPSTAKPHWMTTS